MWYRKSIEEVYDHFKTSKQGLSSIDASERLKVQGKNVLPKSNEITLFKVILDLFNNPIIYILLVAIVLSLILGEYVDAIFIIVVILLDVFLGTHQEWRAVNSASLLEESLKLKVNVIRDGKEIEIDSEDLVTGDLVVLDSGDKIAADLRIVESYNLATDESALTGESSPEEKDNKALLKEIIISDQTNMLFAGTSVMRGRAKAVVVATKDQTEFGKIASTVINSAQEKSPLVLRMEKFTKDIGRMIILISLVLVGVLFYKGMAPREVFFIVVALSVSAIPEGLPVAMTMCLTIASNKMLKKNVLVKKLNSVESLGSCTVIASDKTGTLTLNEQTAKVIMFPDGVKHEITGIGYNDNGKVKKENNKTKEISKLGFINNEAVLEKEDGSWVSHGDSIDIAFKALGYKSGIKEMPEITYMFPYESEKKYSAVFYQEKEQFVTVKGSLEIVLNFCTNVESGKTKKRINKKKILELNENLAKEGYRVIAIAKGKVKKKKEYKEKDLKSLTFVGLVGFIDPLREDAKEAIRKCNQAGIKTLMITGDHPLTSYVIAKELGIVKSQDEVATGEDVDEHFKEGIEGLAQFVKTKKVFSRVTPIQKFNIVNAYKHLGEFIAVTGDGVNDAPALRTANIGIAMGSGTDVAKETSTMIITDDSFSSIVSGVEEGRIAFSNVRKIIYMLLSCGVAEILFFFLAIIFGYPIPLVAIQLLWLNLVTDGIQDVALAYEKKNYDVMAEPPRKPSERVFNRLLAEETLLSGLYMALVVFLTWIFLIDFRGMEIKLARGYILLLMVFMQNVHVFNCRSERDSAFSIPIKNNYFIVVAIIIVLGIQTLVSEVPFLSHILKVEPIPIKSAIVLFVLALPIIAVMDTYKAIKKNKE
ncbi:MAG: HAD-IC family P-type ATPase [Mollicutes bacterium]|nr:HAD-IC family P-type ATPase [Mollicutes bacterium]